MPGLGRPELAANPVHHPGERSVDLLPERLPWEHIHVPRRSQF